MDCKLCDSNIDTEALMMHIKHHIHDQQYGIRANELAAALASLELRVRALEKGSPSGDSDYKDRVKHSRL
jgi:hypothetical protein